MSYDMLLSICYNLYRSIYIYYIYIFTIFYLVIKMSIFSIQLSKRTSCAVRFCRSRRKRKPKTAVNTTAAAKYQAPALLGKKPGEEKPEMVRRKKMRIRKGSWGWGKNGKLSNKKACDHGDIAYCVCVSQVACVNHWFYTAKFTKIDAHWIWVSSEISIWNPKLGDAKTLRLVL